MIKLFSDIETYSPVPLKNGTHAYAEQAEVLLFTYAFDDGPTHCWDVTADATIPADLLAAARNPEVITVWANGGMFDRVVLKHAMPWFYEAVPIERWYDTRVQALAHSLPGGLGELCDIFQVSEEDKKADGMSFIQLFCKPPPKNAKRPRATRHTHPKEWEQFKEYAKRDISSMCAIHKRMPTWNYAVGSVEMALWQLDQKINMRGVLMDVELAEAAIIAVDKAQKELARRTVELTDGEVQRATQRDSLLRHLLLEYGVDLPDMQKSTLERRIEDTNLPWALRELLSIRLQACTTSTSKYRTLIRGVSSDNRLRGTLQFDGASRTGRWSGRLFQPQNLPSRGLLPQPEIDLGIDALKSGCADLLFDDVMKLTSSAIRGCMIAPKGKKLVVADLSNIEGRVLAWLAGETWKLKAFADFDTVLGEDGFWYTGPEYFALCRENNAPALECDKKGEPVRKGHDLYKLAYAKSFGIKPGNVSKDQRQVGKVQELALGYEGGVGAFLTFAAAYNLDLEAMAEDAEKSIPPEIWDEAVGMLNWTKKKGRSTFGLSNRAWVVCESFKRSWRQAHPAVSDFWKDIGYAVQLSISAPDSTYNLADPAFQARSQEHHGDRRSVGTHKRPRIAVRRDGNWLRIRLPSGRYLCYPSPQLGRNDEFSHMGMNQYNHQWSRIKSYGGKLAENITQAASRDIMASAMPGIEQEGFDILLTVHDEIITEAPHNLNFTADRLAGMMAANPAWAEGLPLAAAGFESHRYKK